jgi:hypothetical protein
LAEKRVFGFNHSLHASLFYVEVSCSGEKGLVGDIVEGFGDLNSIFCLPQGNKIDSMMDVNRGKCFWTTTK